MKMIIRNWLIEHFNFVPREDYDRRGAIMGQLSQRVLMLSKVIKELQKQ